ncbi:MAG: hypothetical protein F6K41_33360, partial [Symploca sp. SIO3E6]|nr:hypothetical protein [Caldora sp. SIO3E6]
MRSHFNLTNNSRGAPTCALNRRAPSTDVRPQPTCALNRRAPSTDVRPQPTCAL